MTGVLRATAVTQGWNGYWNKSQHRKLTLEKKILPPLQQGLKPTTFQSWVWHCNHWAVPIHIVQGLYKKYKKILWNLLIKDPPDGRYTSFGFKTAFCETFTSCFSVNSVNESLVPFSYALPCCLRLCFALMSSAVFCAVVFGSVLPEWFQQCFALLSSAVFCPNVFSTILL